MSPSETTEPLNNPNPKQTLTKSSDHSGASGKARHYRPNVLDWANDYKKTYRLLDWLNLNELERDIVFAAPQKGRHRDAFKSRSDCLLEAARYIFTAEDDPVIHREILKDATRVAVSIRGRLENLKKKYQAFNVKIGSEAAILKYENIQPGSNAHRTIESLSQTFPFWKELHKHWRTLPHCNEFWDGGSRAKLVDQRIPEDPSLKGTSGRSRAPSKKLLLSNGGENRGTTGSNSRETIRNREVIIIDELPTKEDECYSQESLRGRKRVHAEFEEGSSSGQETATSGLTAAQQFEQNLAELALKRQKLENEALEKKTAADMRRLELEAEERRRIAEDNRQREKERYELIMKYMAVTGTTAKENDGEHA